MASISLSKQCTESCELKQPFTRRDLAQKVAKSMKGRAQVYKCEGCHRYYICSGIGLKGF